MVATEGTRYKKSLYSRYFSPRVVRARVQARFFTSFPALQARFGYYSTVSPAELLSTAVIYKAQHSDPPATFGAHFTHEHTRYMHMRGEPLPDQLHTSMTITHHQQCTMFGHTGAVIDDHTGLILQPTIREAAPRNYIKATRMRYRTGQPDVIYIPMMGVHKGHKHYFHFLGEYLVELWLYLTNTADDTTPRILVTRDDLSAVQHDVYAALVQAFPYVRIETLASNEALHCPHAHVPCYTTEGKTGVYIPAAYSHFLSKLMAGYYGLPPANPHRRIYLSRRDAKLRRITNEDVLIKTLTSHGYETIATANMSLREQVALFRDTSHLVTTHGAGMINLLFMPDTAKIIEIAPKNFGGCAFLWLSAVRQMTHTLYMGEAEGKHQHFSCDVRALAATHLM